MRLYLSIKNSFDKDKIYYLSGLFRRLGLLSDPRQSSPSGPLTRVASQPWLDFLYQISTLSPSRRLRNPGICITDWNISNEYKSAQQEYEHLIENKALTAVWNQLICMYENRNSDGLMVSLGFIKNQANQVDWLAPKLTSRSIWGVAQYTTW